MQLFLVACLCLDLTIFAQTEKSKLDKPASVQLSIDELSFLTGSWIGTLQYLDYSDDQTKRKLETSMECKKDSDAIEYKFSYIEPNGKKVDGDRTKLTLIENGTQLRLGTEQWRVVSKSIDSRSRTFSIVLSRVGTDNKKPAEFRRMITRNKDELSFRTEITYEKTEKPLVRNEYMLKKPQPK